jgi:hypothetical protein
MERKQASGWASRVRKHAISGDTTRQNPSPGRERNREEKALSSQEKLKKQGLKSGMRSQPHLIVSNLGLCRAHNGELEMLVLA